MDDVVNLKVWSGVAGEALEHRKLKRDSDCAFPEGEIFTKYRNCIFTEQSVLQTVGFAK